MCDNIFILAKTVVFAHEGVFRDLSQQKHPNEDMILIGLILFVSAGFIFIIWYFFKVQLIDFVRWVRVGELYLVKWIYGDNMALEYGNYGKQYASRWLNWMKKVEAVNITSADIAVSTVVAVMPLKKFFAVIIGFMAIFVVFKGPGTSFNRRLTLETLMKEQAKSFPTIAPFLKFDPRKQPIRVLGNAVPEKLPLFAEALSPEEWLAYSSVRMNGGQMDINAMYQGLTKQLGRRWQGPLKLPPYMQGLYAAFALKFIRKRKDSDEMLNRLALAWTPEGGFRPSVKLMKDIRRVIKDPKSGVALQKFADQHAYETTALLRCLARAREEGGVLAPAQFVWLRGVDRNLWYPLNNLGRKSYHAEAAGALVHYTNELIAGQKIPTPRFDEVIKGFEEYMKSGGARAIPELEKKGKK